MYPFGWPGQVLQKPRNTRVDHRANHRGRNWSEEFIKFKIAAYQGRIYYGDIDRTKIDEIYELAQRAGMRAGKISGAGGGGFMMMLVDPVRRMDVMRALQQMPGQIFTCHFTKYGTQGWKIY